AFLCDTIFHLWRRGRGGGGGRAEGLNHFRISFTYHHHRHASMVPPPADVDGPRPFIWDEGAITDTDDTSSAPSAFGYKITERIARGAESVLYLASGNHGAQYCVKAIRTVIGRLTSSGVTKKEEGKLKVSYAAKVRHIKNEFEVGQKLQQGHGTLPVVRMFELRKVKPWMVELGYDLLMEYIDGHDLSEKGIQKSLSLEQKIDYFFQTALALRFMHHMGYVHLDMKPSNVMVSDGTVKLIDFGVTAPIGWKPQSIVGTAGYLSPEQLVCKYVDEATDIFALGVTFAVIFGGRPLLQAQDALRERSTRMEAKFHLENSMDPLVTEIPEVQDIPMLLELIRRCTIPRRENRIRNANTVINSLVRIGKDLGIDLKHRG
ncbi:MAG: serine/threonine protein kinase, partial [Lentisphaerae bacterium]|nr:serine/threonine protein kinase [Lentisphaerota bacterium]